MTQEHIFLDMDGVLCDFVGAALSLFGRAGDEVTDWDIFDCIGITASDFWSTVDREGERFWSDMEPYPWARGLYDALVQRGPVTIASSPSRNPDSLSGKRKWLQKHLPEVGMNFMFGGPKNYLAGTGRVLVDDKEWNVQEFTRCGGDAILFPRPWNSNRTVHEHPLRYTCDKLDKILEPA